MGKVRDVLPAPDKCDSCGSSNIEFHKLNTPGRFTIKWSYIWVCWDCNAAVGCHENTEFPLGYMASAKIRSLRRTLHQKFDKIWLSGSMSRPASYKWLAKKLHIKSAECHISWLGESELEKALTIIEDYLEFTKIDDSNGNSNRKLKGLHYDRKNKQTKSYSKRGSRFSSKQHKRRY